MKAKQRPSAKGLAGPLRQAAAKGKVERVRELLAKGADPNRRPTGQPTPLIEAARAGQLPVVRELLAAGANPSFAHGGKRGTTALLEAIRSHRFGVASALIAAGADVHHDWPGEGQTITFSAASLCNKLNRDARGAERRKVGECLAVVAELLRAGGKMKPGLLGQAAACNNVGLVRLLLDSGFDVNEGAGGVTPFASAVFNRHEDLAVELLRGGADPWGDNGILGAALHQCVTKGLSKVVRAIIDAKGDLNRRGDVVIGDPPPETLVEERDAGGNVIGREWRFDPPPKARNATALIVAVRVGNRDMVRVLAAGGADLEMTDGDGFTPLAWALKLNRQDIAVLLRRAGAKEPEHLEGSPLNALVTAAKSGDVGRVQVAIAAGAEVNAVYDGDHERYTALMCAADAGHLQVVDLLLKAGANPDQSGVDRSLTAGITPLMLAARAGHTAIVKRLLEAGAKSGSQQVDLLSLAFGPKRERGRPLDAAIHEAAMAGHTEVVQLLMEAGAKTSDKSGASGNVLEAAAASGNEQTLEAVLGTKGRKKQALGARGRALMEAVESGNRESVRVLIQSGADVNCPHHGHTALASAARRGDTEMVKMLLEAGATPSHGAGEAPLNELMCAASGGYGDIVRLLLDAGANVDDRGGDGDTALHFAATGAHAEVVEILLAACASATVRNDEGKTPLQAARQIVSVWSGKFRHPLVGKLTNLGAYRHCVQLLEKAERVKVK